MTPQGRQEKTSGDRACQHGGAFFEAVGDSFDDLGRRHSVINADVLDAWFDPSPLVIEALRDHLPWLLRTSPPTECRGLLKTIARVRGVPEACLLPGAGSSDLIFLTLPRWLEPNSKVLILDPSYGEYAHILEKLIGCRVKRVLLSRSDHYQPDLAAIDQQLTEGIDLFVLVNPNSPTGRHIPRADLQDLIRRHSSTRFWIDETYVEYIGMDQSLEPFAAASKNVVICKSMSKVYALSGARVAYLCGPAHLIQALRAATPPWAVGLPAQVAAVIALRDPEYYLRRYEETHALRENLCKLLNGFLDLVPSTTNFVLGHLRPNSPDVPTLIGACRQRGLFLRDVGSMSVQASDSTIRIAIKDAATNLKIADILREVLSAHRASSRERSTEQQE